ERREGGKRFIPARAGNTSSSAGTSSPTPVHPRAGGEHPVAGRQAPAAAGSSPRGRGTRRKAMGLEGHYRFIPARAGNTAPRSTLNKLSRVHPRAGGEHRDSVRVIVKDSGSSPRGRGTLFQPENSLRSCRFIPARAG